MIKIGDMVIAYVQHRNVALYPGRMHNKRLQKIAIVVVSIEKDSKTSIFYVKDEHARTWSALADWLSAYTVVSADAG